MDWKSILEAKAQTAHWSDRVPDVSLIHEILDELHRYCPSKQNHVPYEITVMDWSKPDVRYEIFKNTWCDVSGNDKDLTDVPEARRNPQTLAPYLFLFNYRHVVDSNEFSDENANYYSDLEIGIASTFVLYSAVSKGLDVGFTACHRDTNVLSLGIGYVDPNANNYFFNPLTQKKQFHDFPGRAYEPKPAKEEYIKFK